MEWTVLLVDDGSDLFYGQPTAYEEFCLHLGSGLSLEKRLFPRYTSVTERDVLAACASAVGQGRSCLLVTDAHFTWAMTPKFGGAMLCSSALQVVLERHGTGRAVILSSEPELPLDYH